MKPSSLSLRARFLLALIPLIALIGGAFTIAVYQVIELLESELLHRALAVEMQDFAFDYERDRDRPPPNGNGVHGYVVRPGMDGGLPAALAGLAEGLHEDVPVDGLDYDVARKDVGDARLYLVLDIQPVEQLEARVVAVSVVMGVLALALAAMAAMVLARIVLRPVTQLASLLQQLDPQQRGVRLGHQFGDRDVGIIAAALDGYLDRLDRLIEREQAFTEDASHELRTPLTTIMNALQLLEDEPQLSERGRERLRRVQRATGQMHALIEALLFLAREDGGAAAVDCALDEIVQQAAEHCRDLLQAKPVTLEVETVPVHLRVQPGMAACVVNNLLMNAVHHTERGTIALRLDARSLCVEDTGGGILPADLGRIFDRRFRGSGSRGLGLGLYLVRSVCERLGWTVQAESAQGRGARFTVCFDGAALTKS